MSIAYALPQIDP